MENVLTLITNPGSPALDPNTVATVHRALADAGAACGQADWLARDIACDLAVAGLAPGAIEAITRAALGHAPVDVVAQPITGRRKKLLVADMDATMTEGETIDALAAKAGIGERVAAITARAMRGELDFPAALRERVALLAGLPESALLEVRDAMRPMPGARALVATMRAHGALTVLVSGGFRVFTAHARAMIGFDEDRGNELEILGGKLTGRVIEPILGREAKLETLRSVAAARGIAPADCMAVGDGANDLAMIQAAGMGVAVHAKPVVAVAARASIDHGDLTALLYMQGIRRENFADA